MYTAYNYQTLKLEDDYEGKVIATLISDKRNVGNRPAILYLHGFIDYFFHPHVATAFVEKGFDFYALELRKCGHSLLPYQHPNYCRNIEEYFEEISLALNLIYSQCKSPISLLGHSTGGLIATFYLHKGNKKQLVDKLILNSPFLEFNTQPKIVQIVGIFLSKPISKISPYAGINNAVNPIYPQSLHKDYQGEWNFNLQYKPIQGFPAYFSWIHAISKAQKQIKKLPPLQLPVLLLHSDKSFTPKKFSKEVHTADIVLNSQKMCVIGKDLSHNIVIRSITDAKHDVFLSKKQSREMAFCALFDWLQKIKK